MTMNFNVSPYYDDYNSADEFYKILFRPGYAVQTRELNQIQSILQNQVTSIGQHIFKEGSVVVPGNVMLNNMMPYVKIQANNSQNLNVSTFSKNLESTIITGQTSGATAVVIHVESISGLDPDTLYIRYISAGTTSTYFVDGESIVSDDANNYQVLAIENSSTGFGTLASVSDGIYYINGFFTSVYYTNVVVSKYINANSDPSLQPTAQVGIVWAENIITANMNSALLDNATGTPNYSAPGADRYNISTTFELVDFAKPPANFVSLISIDTGSVTITQNMPSYSELGVELAKRTYDEAGNFIVDDFVVGLRELRKNYVGSWTPSTNYIIGDIVQGVVDNRTYTYQCTKTGSSGTLIPNFINDYGTFLDSTTAWEYVEQFFINDGLETFADEKKYVVEVSAGSAMVYGYEYVSNGLLRLTANKSRDYNHLQNVSVTSYDGSYVLVNNIYSFPETLGSAFPTVSLYDTLTASAGSPSNILVGTAKVRWMEPDSGSSNYRVYLCDIIMNSNSIFENDVKQIYFNNSSSNNFTCDITPTVSNNLTGSISSTGTSVLGVGTLFNIELEQGDYITVDGTTFFKIASIQSNNTLTLVSPLTVTNKAFYSTLTTLYNPINNSSVFAFSHNYIRSVTEIDDSSNNIEYTITRKLGSYLSSDSASSAPGSISITLSTQGETFANVGNASNYLIINNATGLPHPNTSISANNNSSNISITGLSPNTQYIIFAAITKNALQRTKSLEVDNISFTTASSLNLSTLQLGFADCNKILSILQAPSFGPIGPTNPATMDVSSLFNFDSGQRSLYYDIGSITRINEQIEITGSIQVIYEYFSHGAGDYFSIDSYTNAIPYFEVVPKLRDTLDFRPVVSGAGFDSNTVGIIRSGYNITTDYSYYLPRVDVLVVSTDLNISIIEGVAGDTPLPPSIPTNAMPLYYIANLPYGNNPKQTVILNKVDNTRYTMHDIGKLEKRISVLEYYVALSMNEQQTANLSVKDSAGIDMYKNGFIVEPFNDHGIGNVSDPDYSCFINSTSNQLYPQLNVTSIPLVEANTSDADRIQKNYVINDGLITLPYTEIVYSSNLYASRVENINPFSIASFNGNVSLYPSSDTWFDTVTLPTIYTTA